MSLFCHSYMAWHTSILFFLIHLWHDSFVCLYSLFHTWHDEFICRQRRDWDEVQHRIETGQQSARRVDVEVHFGGNTWHFLRNTGLFCRNAGHFYRNTGPFCRNTGHIWRNTGHFYWNTGHLWDSQQSARRVDIEVHVWHVSFTCVTWLIHTYFMRLIRVCHDFPCVWHDSCMTHVAISAASWHCGTLLTWLIHVCHDSFVNALIYSCVWHDTCSSQRGELTVSLPWEWGLEGQLQVARSYFKLK